MAFMSNSKNQSELWPWFNMAAMSAMYNFDSKFDSLLLFKTYCSFCFHSSYVSCVVDRNILHSEI
jgi:hypothetical protein